jgi:hypothetical protein
MGFYGLYTVTGDDVARLLTAAKSCYRPIRWILGLAALGQE